MSQVGEVVVKDESELESVPCPHCKGEGECFCEKCASGPDDLSACREEFDTGRQMEGTCFQCKGLGRVNPDGTPLI